MTGPDVVPEGVDATTPAPARVYDYILGGTSNFEVDRATVEKTKLRVPELEDIAWSNRGFHQRATRWMALEAGIHQFIDIGSGLPTQNNTHEVAHKVDPTAHAVYVDIDPMVEAHAAELLRGAPNTAFITGDVREPETILTHPSLRALIDPDQPVGLMMTALIMLIADESDPVGLVKHYMETLVPGSYLALSHLTHDRQAPEAVQRMRTILGEGRMTLRGKDFVEGLFDGLELVPPYSGADPALTYAGLWGAEDPEAADSDGSRWLYAGVARKP